MQNPSIVSSEQATAETVGPRMRCARRHSIIRLKFLFVVRTGPGAVERLFGASHFDRCTTHDAGRSGATGPVSAELAVWPHFRPCCEAIGSDAIFADGTQRSRDRGARARNGDRRTRPAARQSLDPGVHADGRDRRCGRDRQGCDQTLAPDAQTRGDHSRCRVQFGERAATPAAAGPQAGAELRRRLPLQTSLRIGLPSYWASTT